MTKLFDLFTRFVWWGVPVNATVLSPPVHDGSSAAMARDLYHRLLVRLASIGVYRRQWWLILIATVLTGFSHLKDTMTDTGSVGFDQEIVTHIAGLVVVFMLSILIWMRGLITAAVKAEAGGIIRRSFLRELPADVPEDLRDPWRHGWITADGRPLSAEICSGDIDSSAASIRALWWIPTILALVACGASFFPMFRSVAAGAVIGFATNIIILVKFLFDRNPGKVRVQELESAAAVEGNVFVSAGGVRWAQRAEAARKKQIDEAIRDKSRRVRFGVATGVFAARGDFFAPSADLPFDASLGDLKTHLLVLGGTGSGKTSGILRPLVRQMAAWDSLGMIVMDGKGALPSELGNLPNYRIIDPATSKVSLVAGLEPEILINTIAEVFERDRKGGDRFWTDMAAQLLRSAAVIAHAAGGKWWTLEKVMHIAALEDTRREALKAIPNEVVDEDAVLSAAVVFLGKEWASMEAKLRSNIISTARSWYSALTGHRDLLGWAQTTVEKDTLKMSEVLRGGRIGILVPGYRYGVAGATVTALLKARLYNELRTRVERKDWHRGDETDLVLVMDEAQEIATNEDATMLAIGRSLGLAVVAATQTVEGVEEKLGESVSKKWFSIFGSVIALMGRSPASDEYVAARIGSTWMPVVDRVPGVTVHTSVRSMMVSGAHGAAQTQPTVQECATPGIFTQLLGLVLAPLRQMFGNKGPLDSRLGVNPIIEGAELPALLAEPDTAIAVMTRGRVMRRDIIKLNPQYAFASLEDAEEAVADLSAAPPTHGFAGFIESLKDRILRRSRA